MRQGWATTQSTKQSHGAKPFSANGSNVQGRKKTRTRRVNSEESQMNNYREEKPGTEMIAEFKNKKYTPRGWTI